jgi:hypothetical protein
MQYNVFVGRHFAVFDHCRDGGEKHALIGCPETIPPGKVEVLASMLHVAFDKPRNRRDMTVPRPSGFLRMAVDASVGKNLRHGWRDI